MIRIIIVNLKYDRMVINKMHPSAPFNGEQLKRDDWKLFIEH